jgi:hypothetical protein
MSTNDPTWTDADRQAWHDLGLLRVVSLGEATNGEGGSWFDLGSDPERHEHAERLYRYGLLERRMGPSDTTYRLSEAGKEQRDRWEREFEHYTAQERDAQDGHGEDL